MGGEIGFLIGGCPAVGAWLDQKTDMSPWLLLLGLALGVAAAGWRLAYYLKRIVRD